MIFVTGATGFIGTELVKELIAAGHQVRGLTRSDAGVEQLKAVGAEVLRGDLTDLDSLRSGATGMDAVVNLAFNHDICRSSRRVRRTRSRRLKRWDRCLNRASCWWSPRVSGSASGAPGQPRKESDPPAESPAIPRRPEQAAQAVAAKGVHVAIVRLPQVHDTRKQGLVTMVIQIAREKGVSAYVGDGANRWAAAPLKDVAHLYRLAVENTGPGVTTYHAVQEEGVSLAGDRGDDRQGAQGAGSFYPGRRGGRALWPFFGHCSDDGHAGLERVDAQDAGLGADRAGADRGSANMKY